VGAVRPQVCAGVVEQERRVRAAALPRGGGCARAGPLLRRLSSRRRPALRRSLCWYDAAGNWYINAVCKKEKAKTTAKSSVVSLAWHPNGQVLAVSSTDYRCRVLFAYLEATDGAPAAPPFVAAGAAAALEAGEVLAEWEMTKAWVNDAAWSPSGAQLAFIGHDGLLHVAAFAGAGAPAVESVKTTALPGNVLLWLTEKALVVAGHNMNADVFVAGAGGKWAFAGSADVKVRAEEEAASPARCAYRALLFYFISCFPPLPTSAPSFLPRRTPAARGRSPRRPLLARPWRRFRRAWARASLPASRALRRARCGQSTRAPSPACRPWRARRRAP